MKDLITFVFAPILLASVIVDQVILNQQEQTLQQAAEALCHGPAMPNSALCERVKAPHLN